MLLGDHLNKFVVVFRGGGGGGGTKRGYMTYHRDTNILRGLIRAVVNNVFTIVEILYH